MAVGCSAADVVDVTTAVKRNTVVIFTQTDMEETKKKRGCNMSASEKALLVDLVVKNRSIIENKKTDAVSAQLKAKCWEEVAAEFNGISTAGVHREVLQLKHVC